VDGAKRFLMRNFELVVVSVLVGATAFAVLVAADKLAFLNFFYIPVLVASYFLGRREGVMSAVAAVLMVGIYAVLSPDLFGDGTVRAATLNVGLWGAFTVVTAYVAGTLYEVKESAVNDLQQAYEGILEILAKFIDTVDRSTKDHSVRVADLAAEVAIGMSLSRADVENVRVAGLLHDIGKVDISLDVLRKASALNEKEWEEIRTHTLKGTAMLRPVGGLLADVVPLVEAHHESWDGSGYLGMKGEDIPLGARIVAVCDSYDSMVCDRPYRAGRPAVEAMREIERCAGIQFDPSVVEAFKSVMQVYVEYA
jgi:putative nucleotidyltransferase with HDIG domain